MAQAEEVAGPEPDPFDDTEQNDYKSARLNDRRRSHYTVLSPILGQYSLETNLNGHDDKFAEMRRALARVANLADRAGLPLAVAAEAARVWEQLVSKTAVRRHREVYEAAAVIVAARRLGLPAPPQLWESVVAAAIGLPEDRSRWSWRDRVELRESLRRTIKAVAKMRKLGIDVGRPASPLEAIPDPELRYHAVRLYNELKEAGAPAKSATRFLALYLASIAANRPLSNAEFLKLAREYAAASVNINGGEVASPQTRRAAVELLSRPPGRVGMAPRPGWQLPGGYPPRGGGAERVATVRVRCAVCGHEWDVEATTPPSGYFKLGALASALSGLACPRCGARLGKVVELHVGPARTAPSQGKAI